MKLSDIGMNTAAVVISRKKYKLYSVFTFITPGLGIIRASIPHKRMMTLRNSSYLRPFSAVYITIVRDGEFVNIIQIDGSYIVETLDGNLENIAYAAVAGELLQELFQLYDADRRVFDATVNYSKQIRRRNVRLGTIIFGWQLLSLAGIVPQAQAFSDDREVYNFWTELSKVTHMPVTSSVKQALPDLLHYKWGDTVPVELNRASWNELERLLYAYASYEVGKPLHSVAFLQSL